MATSDSTSNYTQDEYDSEIWKAVPGYSEYEVSSLGRVRSWLKRGNHKQKRSDSPTISPLGRRGRDKRLSFTTRDGRQWYVAVLILTTFVSECPKGMEACHNDGNKDNNRLDNLRWDTHISNEKDKTLHGTSAHGERNGMFKLKETDVITIRDLYDKGKSASEIAKLYGVRHSAIVRIVTGQRWSNAGGITHAPGEHAFKRVPRGKDAYFSQHPEETRGENNGNAKLTPQDVLTIRQRVSSGESRKVIAADYGVSTVLIGKIAQRKLWSHLP